MTFARLLLPAKREWRVSYPPSSRATLISHAVVVGMASASGSAKRVCALRHAGLSRICQDARQNLSNVFEAARSCSPASRAADPSVSVSLRVRRVINHVPKLAWSLMACPTTEVSRATQNVPETA